MNVSSLVNQQFSFALKLIELSTDEKISIAHNRFTHYAFVQSVFLQWDLAVRYWFEELATSAAASAELKKLFVSNQPIHEFSLNQLLLRVEQHASVTGMYCDLSLELLMARRDDKNSWLFVLEHALRSFSMSEREWQERYHNTMNVYEKFSGGETDEVSESAQDVVLVASTDITSMYDTDLHGKHWRNIELKHLYQLICDSKQFIDDGRNLNAEN